MNIFRVGNTSPGRCACSLKDLITNRPSGLDMIRRFSKTLEAFLSLTTLDGDKWIIFKSFHHLQSFFPLSLHVWICLFGQSPLLLPWFLPYFSQGFFASSTSSLFSTLHPKINMLCFKAYLKKNSSQFLDSLLRETRLQSSWFFSISPCVFHFSIYTISVSLTGNSLLPSSAGLFGMSLFDLVPQWLVLLPYRSTVVTDGHSVWTWTQNVWLQFTVTGPWCVWDTDPSPPFITGLLLTLMRRSKHEESRRSHDSSESHTHFSPAEAKHSRFGIFLSLTCVCRVMTSSGFFDTMRI